MLPPSKVILQKLIACRSQRDSQQDSCDAEETSACHDGREHQNSRKSDGGPHDSWIDELIFQLLEYDDKYKEHQRLERGFREDHENAHDRADIGSQDRDQCSGADQDPDHDRIGKTEQEHAKDAEDPQNQGFCDLSDDEAVKTVVQGAQYIVCLFLDRVRQIGAQQPVRLPSQPFLAGQQIDGEDQRDKQVEDHGYKGGDVSEQAGPGSGPHPGEKLFQKLLNIELQFGHGGQEGENVRVFLQKLHDHVVGDGKPGQQQFNTGLQLRYDHVDDQSDDQEQGEKGQQNGCGPFRGGRTETPSGKNGSFIKAHDQIQNIGHDASKDQRADDAGKDKQRAYGGIPVVTQKIQDQGTDCGVLDQFFFLFHRRSNAPFTFKRFL